LLARLGVITRLVHNTTAEPCSLEQAQPSIPPRREGLCRAHNHKGNTYKASPVILQEGNVLWWWAGSRSAPPG